NNYGSFTLLTDGSWSYSLDNSSVQSLAEGASVTDTILVYSGDGFSSETITVTILGTNDVPNVGSAGTGAVTEDAVINTATGTLTISDADSGESSYQAIAAATGAGGYGSFDVDSTGAWTYTLDNSNPAVQALGDGVTATDSIVV